MLGMADGRMRESGEGCGCCERDSNKLMPGEKLSSLEAANALAKAAAVGFLTLFKLKSPNLARIVLGRESVNGRVVCRC